jgi:hypothetical protein
MAGPFSNPSSAGDHGHALYLAAAKSPPARAGVQPPKSAAEKPKLKLPLKKKAAAAKKPAPVAKKKQVAQQPPQAHGREEALLASLAQALPPPAQRS